MSVDVDENKELARRFIAGIDSKNPKVIHELVSHGLRGRNSLRAEERSFSDVAQALEAWQKVAPDFNIQIDDMIAEGDRVAIRWSGRGKSSGPHAAGKEIRVTGVGWGRIQKGQIVEGYWYSDLLSVTEQVGKEQGLGFLGLK